MPSTRDEIRDVLHGAIVGLWEELGYASQEASKVHKSFPEHTPSSKLVAYFWASLADGSQKLRAWAVDVTARPDFSRIPEETVSIIATATIRAWYDLGVDGEGRTLLDSHLSQVQQAFLDLGIDLGGTGLLIESWSEPQMRRVPMGEADDEGDALEAEFQIVARNPNGSI